MKLVLALALAALFLSSGSVAFADDPMPQEDPAIDEPGTPGENQPVTDDVSEPALPDVDAAPDPEPEQPVHRPKAKRQARMATPMRRYHRYVADDGHSALEKSEDRVLGGKHWRIRTGQGAIHVWVPPGYHRKTAGTVVYVHGYWTDADRAWKDYHLATQFRKSHQNALFIVPDAPSGPEDSVKWPALTDLRRAISRANIRLPDGPIVVMGHSGAYRTVRQWVDHKLVDEIILLDAMYAGERQFDEYIKSGKHADWHKMIVVGSAVAQESRSFTNSYKFGRAREGFPDKLRGFTKRERRSKLLYIHSQYGHMQIVTSKKVIPLLLRMTRLRHL